MNSFLIRLTTPFSQNLQYCIEHPELASYLTVCYNVPTQPEATVNLQQSSLSFRKNNLAAKKSRDARRVRENQLRLRVLCLENANRVLREQMDRKDVELVQLR